ncbi:MAG: hypothetical protein R3D82_16025 [Xanthobacteraceae bacterium]
MPSNENALRSVGDHIPAEMLDSFVEMSKALTGICQKLFDRLDPDMIRAALADEVGAPSQALREQMSRVAQGNIRFNRSRLSNPAMRRVSDLRKQLPDGLITRQAIQKWLESDLVVSEMLDGHWFALPSSFFRKAQETARRKGIVFEPPVV